MKKKTALLLVCALLLSLLPVYAAAEESILPVHVQGSVFGGSGTDSIPLEVRFDPAWLSEGDGTAYNAGLAAFCALISADVYFRPKDLDRGTPNRVLIDGTDPAGYDQTVLLTALGFTDVRYIESFRESTYETDTNDSVTLVLAYKDDGAGHDCFVVVVRGCFSAGEWYSIFDPGADTAAYTALTGAHPERTGTDRLKGIDIAANRALAFIDAYVTGHDDPARENCMLITGHSRGAAVAELLGARFEDDPAVLSRTYAFNGPPVTADAAAPGYGTVFNIFDGADFFSDCLPFGRETFYRYGRTLSVIAAEDESVRAAIALVKGTDDYRCVNAVTAERYRSLFGRLFPDRASLYEPRRLTVRYSDEAAARQAREKYVTGLGAEGLGLDAFCSVSEPEKLACGLYSFDVRYCRAALLECIGRVLAYGQSAGSVASALFAQEPDFCALLALLLSDAAGITGGHRLLNSYVLTGYVRP